MGSEGDAMCYSHTQRAPLHLLLDLPGMAALVAAWCLRQQWTVFLILLASGVVTLLFAAAFRYLTVRDEGSSLAIRFGPLPLFSKRIPYDTITDVRVGQTSWIDGWGIHYVPGRGWTYNLWGFQCVVVRSGGREIRIGTDDPDGLVRFLQAKIQGRADQA